MIKALDKIKKAITLRNGYLLQISFDSDLQTSYLNSIIFELCQNSEKIAQSAIDTLYSFLNSNSLNLKSANLKVIFRCYISKDQALAQIYRRRARKMMRKVPLGDDSGVLERSGYDQTIKALKQVGCCSPCFLHRPEYEMSCPSHYRDGAPFFPAACLLISTILALRWFDSNGNCQQNRDRKIIETLKSGKTLRKHVGKVIRSWIRNFIGHFDYDLFKRSSFFEIEDLLTYHNLQLYVLDSYRSFKMAYASPKQYDPKKKPIYLISHGDHVTFIHNIECFFRINKIFFCPVCLKTLNFASRLSHHCRNGNRCFFCQRLPRGKYYSNIYRTIYCDTPCEKPLITPGKNILCHLCGLCVKGLECFQLHLRCCKKALFCDTCQTPKTKRHRCGFYICRSCYESCSKMQKHYCQFSKAKSGIPEKLNLGFCLSKSHSIHLFLESGVSGKFERFDFGEVTTFGNLPNSTIFNCSYLIPEINPDLNMKVEYSRSRKLPSHQLEMSMKSFCRQTLKEPVLLMIQHIFKSQYFNSRIMLPSESYLIATFQHLSQLGFDPFLSTQGSNLYGVVVSSYNVLFLIAERFIGDISTSCPSGPPSLVTNYSMDKDTKNFCVTVESVLQFIKMCYFVQNLLKVKVSSPVQTCGYSSFFLHVLKSSSLDSYDLRTINYEHGKVSDSWMQEREFITFVHLWMPNYFIRSTFTSGAGQVKKNGTWPDGYIDKLGIAFYFCGDRVHQKQKKVAKNIDINKFDFFNDWKGLSSKFDAKAQSILAMNRDIHKIACVFESQWRSMKQSSTVLRAILTSKHLLLPPPLKISDCFKNAYSELLIPIFNKTYFPKHIFHCLDLNNYYSDICMKHPFPVGSPKQYKCHDFHQWEFSFKEKKMHFRGAECFGLILVTLLLTDQSQVFPLLTKRFKEKSTVQFVCAQCAEIRSNKDCLHSLESRSALCSLTFPELNEALLNDYQIIKIHEVVLFPAQELIFKPFLTLMTGLMGLCRDILAAQTQNQVKSYLEEFNYTHKTNVVPSHMSNPKLLLKLLKKGCNASFGKLIQGNTTRGVILKTLSQLQHYFKTEHVSSFTPLCEEMCQVTYFENATPQNTRNLTVVGSYYLSYARIEMYRYVKMLQLANMKIFTVNCDSIFFAQPPDSSIPNDIVIGTKSGNFKRVFPYHTVLKFHALSSSKYVLQLKCLKTGEIRHDVKMAGIQVDNFEHGAFANGISFETFVENALRTKYQKVRLLRKKRLARFSLSKQDRSQAYIFRNQLCRRRCFSRVFNAGTPYGWMS